MLNDFMMFSFDVYSFFSNTAIESSNRSASVSPYNAYTKRSISASRAGFSYFFERKGFIEKGFDLRFLGWNVSFDERLSTKLQNSLLDDLQHQGLR